MNNRFKQIRLSFHLSQEEFGHKIGIESRAHISSIENGNRNITERIVKDVCREFNVSEEWLRTGQGEMFIELSEEEEIAIWAAEVLKDSKESFRRRFVKMLISIPPEEWEKIAEYAKKLFEDESKETN